MKDKHWALIAAAIINNRGGLVRETVKDVVYAAGKFLEWLESRPTPDAPDLGESSASDSESTPATTRN